VYFILYYRIDILMFKKCQLSQRNLTDSDRMDMGQPKTPHLGPLDDPVCSSHFHILKFKF
jgi:hypothetical protein